MKRREFLIGSAGAIGAIAPTFALGQSSPCPISSLTTEGAGGETVATACINANHALAQACAELSAGESGDFAAGMQSAFGEADLAWQTAFYHDDLHGLIHLMGKPANDPTNWQHQTYNVASGQWSGRENLGFNSPGHIYGASTMDFLTGDIFQALGNLNDSGACRVQWRRYETRTWGFAPRSGELTTNEVNDIPNGLVYHPHLFGQNDGGLILDTQGRTMFWRKSNDAVSSVSHSSNEYGSYEGASVYWPAKNQAFVGGGDGQQLLRITPNGSGTPTLTGVGVPPVRLEGASHASSGGLGSIHVHPANPNKLLIVETNGSRAWTSTDGATWTRIGDHPFTLVPRVVCSLRGNLGALWAIARSGTTNGSRLWKPNP